MTTATYVRDGETIDYTPGAAVAAGDATKPAQEQKKPAKGKAAKGKKKQN